MQEAAKLFKILSETTRLRILALLQYGELCVCDLMAVLDMPQSTVSRHLARLKECGLVQDRRKTVWSYYRLTDPESELHRAVLQALQQSLAYTSQFQEDQHRLKSFLATKNAQDCS